MENEKDMKVVQKETQEYLEGLESAELRRLLNMAVFSGTVLKHAPESEQLSERVDAVLDTEFQEMTPEQQGRINRLANKLRERFAPQPAAEAQPQGGWLTQQ